MRGFVGSMVRMVSRWDMRCKVSDERPGEKLLILPLGMWWLAAVMKAVRSVLSDRTVVVEVEWSMRGVRRDSISSV